VCVFRRERLELRDARLEDRDCIGALRRAHYTAPFLTVEQGVSRYVEQLLKGAQ